jgi:hypothetical protein
MCEIYKNFYEINRKICNVFYHSKIGFCQEKIEYFAKYIENLFYLCEKSNISI